MWSGLGLSKRFLPPLKSWEVEAGKVFWPPWKGCCYWGQLSVTPDWLPGQADENPRQCIWRPLALASCLLSFSLTFCVFSARWRSTCAASTRKRSTSVRSATRPSADPTSCVCICSGTRTARTSCAPRVGSSLRWEPAGGLRGLGPLKLSLLLILRVCHLCSQRGLEVYFVSQVWFERDSCSVMSDSLWPHGLWPSRLLYPWDFPGKNTRVGYHFLGIFPAQGSSPVLLHCRQILYQVSH